MKKRIRILAIVLGTGTLAGCGIFPKEEELQKTPIIQAYIQEPFEMAQVKKGDLKLYEKVDAVCMNTGERQYSFSVNDMAFKGIYVKSGERVTAGTVLAELSGDASTQELQIVAKEDGIVTFAKELEQAEKSIAGQIVVIINTNQGYYLSAYTKYWQNFVKGEQVDMRIRGKEYKATIVNSEDIGLPETVRPTDPEELSAVYFHVAEETAYLQSTDKGEVTLLVSEKKDVLYIPKSAVTLVNDKKIVYVEDKDGIRTVKEIETGLETDRYTEVVSGLEEGDSVILE